VVKLRVHSWKHVAVLSIWTSVVMSAGSESFGLIEMENITVVTVENVRTQRLEG